MKKIALGFVIFLFSVNAFAAGGNLYDMFKEKTEIKVYLKDVTCEINNPKVEIQVFKTIFKNALPERVNIKFVEVSDTKDADVVVSARIKEYVFNKVAIPLFFGTSAFLDGATAPKSTARLSVDYAVTSPDGKKLFLEFKHFSTVVRRPMYEMEGEKAFLYAANMNVNRFLYRAFHQKKQSIHGVSIDKD